MRKPRLIDEGDAGTGAGQAQARPMRRDGVADFAFTCDPLLGTARVHYDLAGDAWPTASPDPAAEPRPWSTFDALLLRGPVARPMPLEAARAAPVRDGRAAAAASTSGADPGLAADADALTADAVDAG